MYESKTYKNYKICFAMATVTKYFAFIQSRFTYKNCRKLWSNTTAEMWVTMATPLHHHTKLTCNITSALRTYRHGSTSTARDSTPWTL